MSDTPVSIRQGAFRIFGVEVLCHVLSDGQRIIEAESMERLLAAMADPGNTYDRDEAEREIEAFARWQRGIDR